MKGPVLPAHSGGELECQTGPSSPRSAGSQVAAGR